MPRRHELTQAEFTRALNDELSEVMIVDEFVDGRFIQLVSGSSHGPPKLYWSVRLRPDGTYTQQFHRLSKEEEE